MKKNEIFAFRAPNGVVGTAVVIAIISSSKYQTVALCYGQNRLFTFYEHLAYDMESEYSYGETLVDYVVIPYYDDILERYRSS